MPLLKVYIFPHGLECAKWLKSFYQMTADKFQKCIDIKGEYAMRVQCGKQPIKPLYGSTPNFSLYPHKMDL